MSATILSDLRGLKVLTINPPDSEGHFLVSHLRRIGCHVNSLWPVPDAFPDNLDVVFLSIHDDELVPIRKLLQSVREPAPTMIAIVSYENPAILQVVLESGFFAVIERPLRSFGLLANLAIARSLWCQYHRKHKDFQRYKRHALGGVKVSRAKVVLMASGMSEEEAHAELRSRAQAERVPIEAIADEIISGKLVVASKNYVSKS
jgi:two-component system, response regulator / RNA-binding antiterminator